MTDLRHVIDTIDTSDPKGKAFVRELLQVSGDWPNGYTITYVQAVKERGDDDYTHMVSLDLPPGMLEPLLAMLQAALKLEQFGEKLGAEEGKQVHYERSSKQFDWAHGRFDFHEEHEV